MTVAHFQAPDAPGFKLDPRVVGAFGRFAGGFWRGATKWRAWALTLGLAAFLILSTAATVWLNHWNRWFFDSLEARDVDGLTSAVLVFGLIIAAMAAIGVGIVLTRETLQVRWRAWIVEQLVARWLSAPSASITSTSRARSRPTPSTASPTTRAGPPSRWSISASACCWRWSARRRSSRILWTSAAPTRCELARPDAHHPRLHGVRGAGLRRASPRG